eukprot:TRINITY_DN22739_c0_g2_i1.p1 TRINITY_DN22739_c0_g2~~TRINITY_DN22739_c0_g2_i1.p1  ORF type:complete len:969 (+),score=261.09 TRINITY_DN22739_c0_g2_i1:116-3022(+)
MPAGPKTKTSSSSAKTVAPSDGSKKSASGASAKGAKAGKKTGKKVTSGKDTDPSASDVQNESESLTQAAAPAAVVEPPAPLLTEHSIELRIHTKQKRHLCTIKAYRGWKPKDVKEGIWTETAITPIQQQLFVGEVEMPDQKLLNDIFPPAVEGCVVTLHRRAFEQSQWLEKVMEFGQQLRLAPPHIQDDNEVVMAAVKRSWKALRFASERLRADGEVLVEALAQDVRATEYMHASAWSKREFVIHAVAKDWKLIKLACDDFLRDPEVVLAAVRGNWQALEWALPEVWEYLEVPRTAALQGGWEVHEAAPDHMQPVLKADKDFIINCIRLDWRCLSQAHEDLLEDRDVALAAVKEDWRTLKILNQDVLNDFEILEEAIAHDFCCISLAIEQFPVDQPVLLKIVKKNWEAFAHLPDDMKSDKEIAWAAVSQHWTALEFASNAGRSDPELVIMAARQDWRAVYLALPVVFEHKGVLSVAVEANGLLLEYGSDELKADLDIAMLAAKQTWESMRFAAENVRSDPDIMYEALTQDLAAMDLATPKLCSNPEAMLRYLQYSHDVLPYINTDLFVDDQFITNVINTKSLGKATIIAMCNRNWRCLEHLPDELKADPKVIVAAAAHDWHAIEVAEHLYECWADVDIVREAVKQDYTNIEKGISAMWDEVTVVLEAVKQNYKILEEAGEYSRKRMWENKDIVAAAIEQDPRAILKAGKNIWDNRDLVLRACTADWTIMDMCPKDIAKEYWADRDFGLAAARQSAQAMHKMHELLWEDFDIMRLAAANDYKILFKTSGMLARNLWADRDIVLSAVKQDGLALKQADAGFLDDLEIARIAIKQDWLLMDRVSKYHQKLWWNMEEFAMIALFHGSEKSPPDISFFSMAGDVVKNNKDVIMKAVAYDGQLLRYASPALRGDFEVVEAAVEKDGLAVEYASDELKNNYEIARAAVKQNGAALDLISEELQRDERLVEYAGIT